MTESRIPRSTYSSAQTLALILSETPPPSSRARLEKTSFPELSKLEEDPEEQGSFVPAVGDVITANCSDTASSTDTGSMVVLVLSLACDLPAGRCGDCMAACTALVTAAVSVAVKAPRSMFVLGSVADSGGTVVAGEAEGIVRARLGRPREVLPDAGRLREDIAFRRCS